MNEEFTTKIFINEGRERCILRKSFLEEYHDRNKNQTAWMEITKVMYPNLEEIELNKIYKY